MSWVNRYLSFLTTQTVLLAFSYGHTTPPSKTLYSVALGVCIRWKLIKIKLWIYLFNRLHLKSNILYPPSRYGLPNVSDRTHDNRWKTLILKLYIAMALQQICSLKHTLCIWRLKNSQKKQNTNGPDLTYMLEGEAMLKIQNHADLPCLFKSTQLW